jgi:hypothetical protein
MTRQPGALRQAPAVIIHFGALVAPGQDLKKIVWSLLVAACACSPDPFGGHWWPPKTLTLAFGSFQMYERMASTMGGGLPSTWVRSSQGLILYRKRWHLQRGLLRDGIDKGLSMTKKEVPVEGVREEHGVLHAAALQRPQQPRLRDLQLCGADAGAGDGYGGDGETDTGATIANAPPPDSVEIFPAIRPGFRRG